MKILIFNWRDLKHSWAGGGEIYVFEQARRWIKMGHEVRLFCSEDPEKKLPAYEIIDGIKIYRKGGRYSLYLWAIWYYFVKLRGWADVAIDVENGIPFFTPLFVRIPKVSFVYHIHGDQFKYEVPFLLAIMGRFIERYLYPLFYREISIIVISSTTKKMLVSYGLPEKNISIVYCGIQKSFSRVRRLKKFSSPTILYLGRIKRYKRVDLLVSIFDKIIRNVPRAKLVIAGWGTEASNIVNLVMKNKHRRKIKLLGPVTNAEKRTLLAKSWVFVNPSIGEGWSIAVIEANIHGTPAIGFNVPGLSESIRHKKTGLLAKNNDELIDSICTVLTQKSLRTELGINSYDWATKFNWEKTATESMKILKQTYQLRKAHRIRIPFIKPLNFTRYWS